MQAPTFGLTPITYSGSGDAIQPIGIPDTSVSRVMITITHTGASNIMGGPWLRTSTRARALLVNEIGAYSGTMIITNDATGLSIEADGGWTATIEPISTAPKFAETYTGSGDSVVIYPGDKGVADMAHSGQATSQSGPTAKTEQVTYW